VRLRRRWRRRHVSRRVQSPLRRLCVVFCERLGRADVDRAPDDEVDSNGGEVYKSVGRAQQKHAWWHLAPAPGTGHLAPVPASSTQHLGSAPAVVNPRPVRRRRLAHVAGGQRSVGASASIRRFVPPDAIYLTAAEAAGDNPTQPTPAHTPTHTHTYTVHDTNILKHAPPLTHHTHRLCLCLCLLLLLLLLLTRPARLLACCPALRRAYRPWPLLAGLVAGLPAGLAAAKPLGRRRNVRRPVCVCVLLVPVCIPIPVPVLILVIALALASPGYRGSAAREPPQTCLGPAVVCQR
jgi:hypothetical protein